MGQAEVHDHRLAATIDHDVRWLQIAVHDAVVVRLLQRLGELADGNQNLPHALRLGRIDEVRQQPSLDVGHRDVVLAVDVADVVDGTNPRVPKRGSRAGLAVEADQRLLLGIGREFRRFDRDLPLELGVLSEIDSSHRPLAQRANDLVAAELSRQLALGRVTVSRGDRRSRRQRLPARLAEETRGNLRDVAERFGSEAAEFVFGRDELPQLVGDVRMLCDEVFRVDRFAAIDAVEVVFERRLQPRIVRRDGQLSGGWFVHRSASGWQS